MVALRCSVVAVVTNDGGGSPKPARRARQVAICQASAGRGGQRTGSEETLTTLQNGQPVCGFAHSFAPQEDRQGVYLCARSSTCSENDTRRRLQPLWCHSPWVSRTTWNPSPWWIIVTTLPSKDTCLSGARFLSLSSRERGSAFPPDKDVKEVIASLLSLRHE